MASFQGTTTGSPAIEVLKQQLQESDSKIREGQRAPNKLNPNRHAARPMLINMAKGKQKGRRPKAAREQQGIHDEGTPIRLSAVFSTETLQARRGWRDPLKTLKERTNNLPPPNTLSSKTIISNRRGNQEFLQQTNTERVLQYKTHSERNTLRLLQFKKRKKKKTIGKQ